MLIEQVTQLKTQCESLLEKHEEDIEDWYFEKQDQVISISNLVENNLYWIRLQVSFEEYVCRQKALKKGEDSCLAEQLQKLKKKKKSKKEKGETGSKTELWLTWSFVPVLYSYFLLTPPGPPGLTSAVNFRESGWRWAVGWGWIFQFFVVDKMATMLTRRWGCSTPPANRPTRCWLSREVLTSSCFLNPRFSYLVINVVLQTELQAILTLSPAEAEPLKKTYVKLCDAYGILGNLRLNAGEVRFFNLFWPGNYLNCYF